MGKDNGGHATTKMATGAGGIGRRDWDAGRDWRKGGEEDPYRNGTRNSAARSDPGHQALVLERGSPGAGVFGSHRHALIDGGVEYREGCRRLSEKGGRPDGDAPGDWGGKG